MSLDGTHDMYTSLRALLMGIGFRTCLVPILNLFNGINARLVVVIGNASIHHVDKVTDLIEAHANARLCFFPPYSPDLMPVRKYSAKLKQ